MKLSKEEAHSIYSDLIRQQSMLSTILGSLAGVCGGVGLFIIFVFVGGTFTLALFVPAALVGVGAKFTGKPLQAKYRVIPGFFGALIYAIGVYFLFATKIYYLALTPIAFGVAYYFSKVRLDKTQQLAVWQKGLEQ